MQARQDVSKTIRGSIFADLKYEKVDTEICTIVSGGNFELFIVDSAHQGTRH